MDQYYQESNLKEVKSHPRRQSLKQETKDFPQANVIPNIFVWYIYAGKNRTQFIEGYFINIKRLS